MSISPLAGKPAPSSLIVDVEKLIKAYYAENPDVSIPTQRVSFGTSGHRGSSFDKSFNEAHILAISQAIALYRREKNISGPLFLGIDTHALSKPAFQTALEVLAANGVEVMIAGKEVYTPTPVISHAILCYNKNRKSALADGIVITPSHNPPSEGGFKYNPPSGGPADVETTKWIEDKANEFLKNKNSEVKRITFEAALQSQTTHRYNYLDAYVDDLSNVIDMQSLQTSNVRMGVDPLGGAGVHYWRRIAEKYNLNLTVVSEEVDPTFRFMTVDWDGKIRMDPSSSYAMQRLIHLQDKFDVAFACDTDHDRHGIVTKSCGLLQPNNYLSTAIYYLFGHRPLWKQGLKVGKTVVSSQMIDRVTAGVNRGLYEVPVGFKWFVEGLLEGSLGFVGEESAGASFLRIDGSVWTTDKDGIIASLLAGEITARTGKDPGVLFSQLTEQFGIPFYNRIDSHATVAQKEALKKISKEDIHSSTLAGEKITSILTKAPGNNAPIGGLKVVTEEGWFAARPSGTEEITKIYAESFKSQEHLDLILKEAHSIVEEAILSKRS